MKKFSTRQKYSSHNALCLSVRACFLVCAWLYLVSLHPLICLICRVQSDLKATALACCQGCLLTRNRPLHQSHSLTSLSFSLAVFLLFLPSFLFFLFSPPNLFSSPPSKKDPSYYRLLCVSDFVSFFVFSSFLLSSVFLLIYSSLLVLTFSPSSPYYFLLFSAPSSCPDKDGKSTGRIALCLFLACLLRCGCYLASSRSCYTQAFGF